MSRIICGDALTELKKLPDESVHCCVTSPPYWGLRDYGVPGQLGLEKTPEEYVEKMVAVFAEVRRVLRNDGTLWLNLGDSYNAARDGGHPGGKAQWHPEQGKYQGRSGANVPGLKPKDLVGIPWRVAFALQSSGWYLRSEIIWAKANPMPESVTDRPTKSHEQIFLLSKNATYFYDAEAVKEPSTEKNWQSRYDRAIDGQKSYPTEKQNGIRSRVGRASPDVYTGSAYLHPQSEPRGGSSNFGDFDTRNRRSVWTITTKPFKEAHFATFPPEIPEICIKAGCPPHGTVLDPFGGAGTVGLVAEKLGREYILIELNPKYVEMAEQRIERDCGLLLTIKEE
jgi:DNA modification methylase